jgi:hypothetical protein
MQINVTAAPAVVGPRAEQAHRLIEAISCSLRRIFPPFSSK